MNFSNQILAIDTELELLSEIKSTERNCPIMGRRKDLMAKRERLMITANFQASLLKTSHRKRF